jgi:hypothetical protein
MSDDRNKWQRISDNCTRLLQESDGRPLCRCGYTWQQHEPGTQAVVACYAYRPWPTPLTPEAL